MKKSIIGVLLLASLLTVSACGNSSKEGKGSDDKVVELHSDKGEKKTMKNVIPIIKDQTGLTLKNVDTIDFSAYQTNIQQSLSSKKAPDLFTWWTGSQLNELVANDLVEDLTDVWPEFVKAGVSDEIKEGLSVDGKVYGSPLNILYNGVFYNKEIFTENNLEEPKTLDDFLAICETLKQKGITPIGLGNTWQSFVWPMALVGSMDPSLYDEWTAGKVGFDDPRLKKVFYLWADMLEKGYFTAQQQDQAKDFATGQVAMILNATNMVAGFTEDYGLVSGENIDIFVLPSQKADQKRTIFYEVAPILVAKNGQKKEEAIKVLTAYYDQEAQQAYADISGSAATTNVKFADAISKRLSEDAGDSENFNLKLRYYEQFTPEIVNLSIDEYWKIADKPTKEQVDKSLEEIQKQWEAVK